MHLKAEKILVDVLDAVGGDWQRWEGGDGWQMWEDGDCAKHTRRRLSPNEMKLLYSILPTAPVFTHGCALQMMEKSQT
jgi:hypothetical protein